MNMISIWVRSNRRLVLAALFLLLAAAPAALHAQSSGPMKPPDSAKFPTPPPPIKPEAPAVPPEEIIRRFAAKEDEMIRAIRGYTFQKSVRVEEIGPGNKTAGQLEVTTQQRISPDGKLFEKPVSREASTLKYLDLQRGDSDLVAQAPMFPLSTVMLPKYEITFGGKQPLDDLSVYYFTIKPRALERAHAYFSGVVWVDEQDFVIVKMMGKWVTETGDVTSSNLPFSVFETYRQQVGNNLWFPAYARSDETYQSGDVSVPIRIIIKWTNYTPQSNAPAADYPAPSAPADSPKKP
jgi:hypothetical protein